MASSRYSEAAERQSFFPQKEWCCGDLAQVQRALLFLAWDVTEAQSIVMAEEFLLQFYKVPNKENFLQ